MKKRWFESRILWVQVGGIAVAVITYLGAAGILEGLGLPRDTAILVRNQLALVMVIVNAATAALRFDTGAGLSR